MFLQFFAMLSRVSRYCDHHRDHDRARDGATEDAGACHEMMLHETPCTTLQYPSHGVAAMQDTAIQSAGSSTLPTPSSKEQIFLYGVQGVVAEHAVDHRPLPGACRPKLPEYLQRLTD